MSSRTICKKRELTQERLRQLLHYNPDTGIFTRNNGTGGKPAGSVAGCVCPDTGYIQIYVDYRNYTGHRLAFLFMLGRWPTPEADHQNRVRDDNRWDNLREADRGDQAQNMTLRSDNKSGYTGVHWIRGKARWGAEIKVGGQRHILGQGFKTAEEAAAAYAKAKAKFHPFQPTVPQQ